MSCPCDSDEPYRTLDCDEHVNCDVVCKAKNEPKTFEDYIKAYVHWKSHGFINGCSHGS